MPSKLYPHPEERPKGASRRTHGRYAALRLILAQPLRSTALRLPTIGDPPTPKTFRASDLRPSVPVFLNCSANSRHDTPWCCPTARRGTCSRGKTRFPCQFPAARKKFPANAAQNSLLCTEVGAETRRPPRLSGPVATEIREISLLAGNFPARSSSEPIVKATWCSPASPPARTSCPRPAPCPRGDPDGLSLAPVQALLARSDVRRPGARDVGQHGPDIGIAEATLVCGHIGFVAREGPGGAVLDHPE